MAYFGLASSISGAVGVNPNIFRSQRDHPALSALVAEWFIGRRSRWEGQRRHTYQYDTMPIGAAVYSPGASPASGESLPLSSPGSPSSFASEPPGAGPSVVVVAGLQDTADPLGGDGGVE